MDFVHVTILSSLVFEAQIALCALLFWLVGLHVRLKLLWRCETLSTLLMLTRMRLAVDHPHVPLHHPLVRTRVVTVFLMVTLVGLHFRTLPGVISEALLKQIAITTGTVANSVDVFVLFNFLDFLTFECAH